MLASIVSFRLGGPDGVSVQAATWGRALERLGYSLRRVAGELADGPRAGDVLVPGLAVAAEAAPGPRGQRPAAPQGPSAEELRAALLGSDVVVVENVLSLPLHLEAARVLTDVLADGLAGGATVLLHHHDFAWQRTETAAITELPPRLPGAVHVTINDFSRRELAERGIEAVTVRNAFDLDAAPGRRDGTRAGLGVDADDLLVLQPTRAIARKNIPAALRLAEGLAARLDRPVRFWLPGPAEDGYAATLAAVLAGTTVPVLRDRPDSMADAYAACDLVTFPSTGGEGFGQPVIESVAAGRPLAVLRYPALDEILAFGLLLPTGRRRRCGGRRPSREPDAATMARNRALAEQHFSMTALERRLRQLLGMR